MRVGPVVLLGLVFASCGGFKSETGPGPEGALPSGYCCTSDADCRQRNCIDFGGSKMCADECKTQDSCDGGLPGLVCVGGTQFVYGECQPQATGTQCVPASQFSYGAKPLGACCTPTWNGANGLECEGGSCGQTDNGPFMCTNACSRASDCPGPFMCSPVGDHYGLCIPLDSTMACTQ